MTQINVDINIPDEPFCNDCVYLKKTNDLLCDDIKYFCMIFNCWVIEPTEYSCNIGKCASCKIKSMNYIRIY